MPTIYRQREYVEAGGLTSYGRASWIGSACSAFTPAAFLKARSRDLLILRAVKFEFVINLQTAKTIGLEVPPTLLGRADEVIE